MKPTRFLLLAGLLALATPTMAQYVAGPGQNLTPKQSRNNSRMHMSLDGSRIGYTYVGLGTSNDAYVMDADGSNKKRLTYNFGPGLTADAQADEWPSLNADGTKALMHVWTGSPSNTNIVEVDLATGTAAQLTSAPGNEAWPLYSPDGSKILFLSNHINNNYQVFVMNAAPESAANVPVQITNFVTCKYARWTPDGQHILIAAKTEAHNNFEIYRLDAVDSNGDGMGDNLTRLTNTGADLFAEQPSQPTVGSRIFFVANYAVDKRMHVFSMAPNGSDVRQVTAADYWEDFAYAAADKLIVTANSGGHNAYTREHGYENSDVVIYPLAANGANGTLDGRVVIAPNTGVEGVAVSIYDGQREVQTAYTDGAGRFSVSLPPGGYVLKFDAFGVIVDGITRGVQVLAGATTQRDFAVPSEIAPAPNGTLPTIKGNTVDVRWTAVNSPWTVSGYNVYRSATENGPWTKANAALVPASGTPFYVDTNPGDLYSAFYLITAVINDGVVQTESTWSDVVQAANNMIFNPSFELVDGLGDPIGWRRAQWGDSYPRGTTTDEKVTGDRSAYITAGAAAVVTFWDTDTIYGPAATPGDRIVFGQYARIKDAGGGGGVNGETAYGTVDAGTASAWYNTAWEATTTIQGTAAAPTLPWTWQFNQATLPTYEESKFSRYSAAWYGAGGAGVTPGVGQAFFDEVRFQVRRVGATGVVSGRVVSTSGEPISGALVTIGDKTVTSGTGGLFIIRDVPTGPFTATATMAGYTGSVTADNIGGARPDLVMPPMEPLTFTGIVLDAENNPVPGAPVRLVYGVGTSTNQSTQNTTTNAEGRFAFPDPPRGSGETAIVARAPGYRAERVAGAYGSFGPQTLTIKLTVRPRPLQVPKATSVPSIDGVLSAGEWADAAVFPLDLGETSPETATTGYAKWDEGNIYLAFVAREPNPAGIMARANSRDNGKLWYYDDLDSWNADDIFQVRLDPMNGAEAGYGYELWQTYVNTNINGQGMADIAWRRAVPSMWDGGASIDGFTFSTKVDDQNKAWYAEIKIPTADLDVPNGLPKLSLSAGTEWLMGIHRHRHQPEPSGMRMNAGPDGWMNFLFVNTIITKPGDLDGDLEITLADALIALRIAAGLENVGSRVVQGDVAGNDGAVNLTDALRILRKANGLEPGFPQ